MVLIIDNYDSFTHNLVQYIGTFTSNIKVIKNDEMSIEDLKKLENIERILISPGPKTPSEAGISIEVIRHFMGVVPIFGVCLGHQSIAQVFGCDIIKAKKVMHGKKMAIFHDGKGIFRDVSQNINVGRYHSLVADINTFTSKDLEITAITPDGVIMGVRHKKYAIEGVQFHPESILTDEGLTMIKNFIELK